MNFEGSPAGNSALLKIAASPALVTLFVITVSLPYFVNLGSSSLWDSNEAFYAQTPREMMATGDYLAPRFNESARTQKPPLAYWVILLSYKVFGISEWSARLPGALASLGIILFTFGLTRLYHSAPAGLAAVVILSCSARFFIVARRLPIDIYLLFWLTGAAYFSARATRSGADNRWTWGLFYAFVGLGFMTKGPIAVLIPFGSLALWKMAQRDLKGMRLHPFMGLVILGLITLPWYLLVYRAHGWEYIGRFFLRDNWGRFAGESFGPSRGMTYYLPVLVFDFFPWSILIPALGIDLWRRRADLTRPEYGFPLAWCLLVFGVFSLSANKQEYYILPMYPMIAVLLAGAAAESLRPGDPAKERTGESSWIWMFFLIALLFMAAALFSVLGAEIIFLDESVVPFLVPAALLLVASTSLAWSSIRRNLRRCWTISGLMLWLVYLSAAALVLPAIEPLRPVKDLCRVIAAKAESSDLVGYYMVSAPSMVYYLQRPIFEEFDPDAMVERFRSPATVYCLLSEKDYNYFVGKRDLVLYVHDRRPRLVSQLRHLLNVEEGIEQELLLVSNRPLITPPPDARLQTP